MILHDWIAESFVLDYFPFICISYTFRISSVLEWSLFIYGAQREFGHALIRVILVAAILRFCCSIYFLWKFYGYLGEVNLSDEYFLPWCLYFLTLVVYPLMSCFAHAFNNMSVRARHVCFFVDYVGCSLYTFGEYRCCRCICRLTNIWPKNNRRQKLAIWRYWVCLMFTLNNNGKAMSVIGPTPVAIVANFTGHWDYQSVSHGMVAKPATIVIRSVNKKTCWRAVYVSIRKNLEPGKIWQKKSSNRAVRHG